MKITFLSENKTENPKCLAEHGLSIFIEVADQKILFDTGASDIFIKNAKSLNVDLSAVTHVVISHGHYDHTEGLPYFCNLNSQANIFIHKNSFNSTYGMENGILNDETSGIRWDEKTLESLKPRLTYTEGPLFLSEDILISGSIPDISEYPSTESFFIKDSSGALSLDPMDHEQMLIIRARNQDGSSRGIYVFSGCSHKSVPACLAYAKFLFPEERLCGFIAGMHLYNSNRIIRQLIINQIVSEDMDLVMPVHCTGIEVIAELKNIIGDNCKMATAGSSYSI